MHRVHNRVKYLDNNISNFQITKLTYLPVAFISTLLPLVNFSNRCNRFISKSIKAHEIKCMKKRIFSYSVIQVHFLVNEYFLF
jgi:hypothetical protein